jgi:hypothetical protein
VKNAIALLLGAVLGLAGCPTSSLSSTAGNMNQKYQAEGLPFRWSVQDTGDGEALVMRMLPLPGGPTRANAQLAEEILGAIRTRENSKGRVTVELQEVKYMDDGREAWVLQSLGQGVAYVVRVGSSSPGITNVELLGPYTYSK